MLWPPQGPTHSEEPQEPGEPGERERTDCFGECRWPALGLGGAAPSPPPLPTSTDSSEACSSARRPPASRRLPNDLPVEAVSAQHRAEKDDGPCSRGPRATTSSAFCPAGEYQLSTDEQSPLGRPPSP